MLSWQAPHTVPLYRLYSGGASDHFYTTNADERAGAIKGPDYADEGIAAYVYLDASCGTVPLYRMYSSKGTDHFYTTNGAERINAVTNLGFADEGIIANVNPQNVRVDLSR